VLVILHYIEQFGIISNIKVFQLNVSVKSIISVDPGGAVMSKTANTGAYSQA
jgi:hypothetical protein